MTGWQWTGWSQSLGFFIDCINRKDMDACMERLDESVAVSEVQTKARLASGIIFAADQK